MAFSLHSTPHARRYHRVPPGNPLFMYDLYLYSSATDFAQARTGPGTYAHTGKSESFVTPPASGLVLPCTRDSPTASAVPSALPSPTVITVERLKAASRDGKGITDVSPRWSCRRPSRYPCACRCICFHCGQVAAGAGSSLSKLSARETLELHLAAGTSAHNWAFVTFKGAPRVRSGRWIE